jgi:hypothetical protein
MIQRKKTYYRKGLTLFNQDTKKKIIFGKWNDDGSAACITADKMFVNIPREEMDEKYTSYAQLEKEAREQRRGQCW